MSMSQRDGHATGGAGASARPADALPLALAMSPAWEEVFPVLGPGHQLQILEIARRQDGTGRDPVNGDAVQSVLQQALSNRLSPAPLVEAVDVFDAGLDDVQRDAVARAVQTLDLFLIDGPVGTGKSRVAIEVVRQVAGRGRRALVLSPDPAALDAHLPTLADVGATLVRRLGPGETADRLPAPVAALTAASRQAAVRDNLVRRAAESLAAAEERARRAESLSPVWEELAALAERQAARSAEQAALRARREALTDEVQRDAESSGEPAPFYVQRLRGVKNNYARRLVGWDERTAELARTRTEAEERRRAAEAEVAALRPKVEALTGRRWYTLTFWMAKRESDVVPRLAAAEDRLAAAKAALDEIAVREQKLAADRRLAEAEHAADMARLIDAEVARRRADLDADAARIESAAAADVARETELRARARKAGADPDRTVDQAAADLAAARSELDAARRWAAEVQARTDELVREACTPPSVVAGPVAGVGDDRELGGGRFDLLVIDDAHLLTESDFLAAARLAQRWLLIGEPVEVFHGRGKGARPDVFARLAAALRHEVWAREGNGVVCRLHPVRGADRKRLECEPVVDAPDIELRLFTPPDGAPALAEVSFPERMSPATAREYLCRELGEVTCQPRLRTGVWETTADSTIVRFGPRDVDAAFATIGAGVREELTGLDTRAIHFDTSWPFDRAKAWVAEHAGRREGGRIARLGRPCRACAPLARWLNRAFAAGYVLAPAADEPAHVAFLAVPDTDSRRRRHNGHGGRIGGAGYEIDLADVRQRAALPAEFGDLPAAGYVNVPEAQALVRYLEPLAGAGVVVTSPFAAQAAVLRKLVSRSPWLAAIRVLDPSEAAKAECDLLAISLTRSHVARAVPFGDSPAVLASLVSRARRKVLFAGDPGTLARRLQWEGPVDHLDAAEAARERAWVAALADCPRVTGPRARPNAVEGAWA
jgi:hypothetical protein